MLIEKMLEDSPNGKVHTTPNDSQEFASGDGKIVMVVDLGDGRKKKIYIGEGDDANTLARKFCFENNLEMKVIGVLARNIRTFMGEAFGEKGLSNISRISEAREEDSVANQSVANDRNGNTNTPIIRSSSRNRVNTSTSSVFDRLYSEAQDRLSKHNQVQTELSREK